MKKVALLLFATLIISGASFLIPNLSSHGIAKAGCCSSVNLTGDDK